MASSGGRDVAVELLNAAQLGGDAAGKVDRLKGLLELVVRKEPALLPEFLPHVLELRCDPAAAVRKWLPDFAEAAAAAAPTPATLRACLACLGDLAGDATPAVAKRALASCYVLFRAAYTLLALHGAALPAEEAAPLWVAACELKAGVLALAGRAGNEGVRLAAAKFLEQGAMLLTAETVPAVAGVSQAAQPLPPGNPVFTKAALVKEAESLLGQVGSAGGVEAGREERRPRMGHVARRVQLHVRRPLQHAWALVPSPSQLVAFLKMKLGSGAGGSEVPGPLAITAIKAAGTISQQRPQFMGRLLPPLLALATSGEFQPDAGGVQASIAAALKAALLAVSKCQHPTAVAWRRKLGDALAALGAGGEAALPALPAAAGPSGQPDRAGKRSRWEETEANKRPKLEQEPAGPTSAADLAQVQQVVQALVAGRDVHTLAAFLDGLQPGVLADVVLSQLAVLPARHALLPDAAPLDPWLLQLVHLHPAAVQQQHPPLPGLVPKAEAPMPAAAAAAPPIKAPPAKAPPVRLAPAALQPFKLEPVPLTPAQEQALRRDVVMRILRTEKTPSHHLRASLVARLAATGSAEADGVVEAVVEQLLQDLHTRGGYEIAMQWLHVLFTQLCGPFDPAHSAALANDDLTERGVGSGAVGQEQAAGPSGSGSSGTARQQQLVGSRYEHVLLALLGGLRQRLPPSDRTLARLLAEAPALPMPAVAQHLRQLCAAGPDWSTLALLAARDVILLRPPSRQPMLQLVLAAAAGEDEDARGKAVRLLANRLFPEPNLSAHVEQYAREQLDAMVRTSPPAAATQEQRPAPAPAAPADGEAPASVGVEAQAALGSDQQAAPVASAEQQGRQEQGQQEQGLAAAPELSEERAGQLCALYCALCTKKHSLLRHLFEVFGQTSDGGQAAIHRNAGGLAKTLGPTAPTLLAVVQAPPPGSLPLVLHMLHVLTDTAVPPQPLVAACLQLHSTCGDPRALVATLPGMERATVLRLLPALLDLPPEALRGALQRLVAPLPAPAAGQQGATVPPPAPAPFSPVEVLTALHTLDLSRDPKLLRKAMQAVTVCLSSPELFPPESLAASISALLTRVPLPQLFMRTVIQTLAAAPRLRAFVVGVLGQLASKRVWEDGAQWKGWVMCAQQTAPDSFPALLQLPASVLGQALQQLSTQTRQQLAEYTASPACAIALPQATRDLLAPVGARAGSGLAAEQCTNHQSPACFIIAHEVFCLCVCVCGFIERWSTEPLQQWEIPLEKGKEVECLLDRIKDHFRTAGPAKTAVQQAAQQAALLKSLPEESRGLDPALLSLATSMGLVENIALLSNSCDNGFIGVNMYVDDEGSIKGLPTNLRASEIAACCGKPMDVKGDAFLARVFDNGDDFARLNLALSEVSSSAAWVKEAKVQNDRKRQQVRASLPDARSMGNAPLATLLLTWCTLTQDSGEALVERMRATQTARTSVKELTPAEAAKDRGNAAFKAGDWAAAADSYGEALALDGQLTAARNNRALALLKMERWGEAQADASQVLAAEPGNVKALLRRAAAREGLGELQGAEADLRKALRLQPVNKEAAARLVAVEQRRQAGGSEAAELHPA
eukprot:scaffold16.g2.t1